MSQEQYYERPRATTTTIWIQGPSLPSGCHHLWLTLVFPLIPQGSGSNLTCVFILKMKYIENNRQMSSKPSTSPMYSKIYTFKSQWARAYAESVLRIISNKINSNFNKSKSFCLTNLGPKWWINKPLQSMSLEIFTQLLGSNEPLYNRYWMMNALLAGQVVQVSWSNKPNNVALYEHKTLNGSLEWPNMIRY